MYKHTLLSKIYTLISTLFLIGIAIYLKQWGYRLLFGALALMMCKEVVNIFTGSYSVDEDGLFKQDVFGKRKLTDWYALEYITITKRNRKWIALVDEEKITYLRNDIIDSEQLLKDIIHFGKKNKKLAVHDLINERNHLGLKLNDEGMIIRKK